MLVVLKTSTKGGNVETGLKDLNTGLSVVRNRAIVMC